jgi:uncharacterized membrane protein SirB2
MAVDLHQPDTERRLHAWTVTARAMPCSVFGSIAPLALLGWDPDYHPGMSYLIIKSLHVTCVVASISLFLLRAVLQQRDTPWREWPLLRVAPHLIDTVLLGSGIWLAIAIRQYPFIDGWLTAKVVALLAYIWFGKIALAPGVLPYRRAVAFAAALDSVGYIVGVALTRSPRLGFG